MRIGVQGTEPCVWVLSAMQATGATTGAAVACARFCPRAWLLYFSCIRITLYPYTFCCLRLGLETSPSCWPVGRPLPCTLPLPLSPAGAACICSLWSVALWLRTMASSAGQQPKPLLHVQVHPGSAPPPAMARLPSLGHARHMSYAIPGMLAGSHSLPPLSVRLPLPFPSSAPALPSPSPT